MKMEIVPLADLGRIVSGSTPRTNVSKFWNGDIPWITPADLSSHDGIYYKGSLKMITKKGFESCSTTMLPSGAILFSSRAPIGHCAVAKYPVCTNQGFKNIVPNEKLDSVYGFFALKYLTPSIQAKGHGATFAEVTKEMMEEVGIPYCDILAQKKISEKLAQADHFCRLRRYMLETSKSFLPALFIKTFGDLWTNIHGFEIFRLGDICDVRDGTHDSPKYQAEGFPLVTSKNLVNGYIDLSGADLISKEEYEKANKRSKVDRGDILMPMIGTIGNPVLVENEPNYAIKNVALIKFLKDSPERIYIREILKSSYFDLITSRNSRGGTQKFIALGDIRDFPIPVPPKSLQSKFVNITQKYERIKAAQVEALRQAEHLFQSLLQQAFGEN